MATQENPTQQKMSQTKSLVRGGHAPTLKSPKVNEDPVVCCTFHNIHPVRNAKEAFPDFIAINHKIRGAPMQFTAKAKKTVHTVRFSGDPRREDCLKFLKASGKRLCTDSPAFLLGLMRKLRGKGIPKILSRFLLAAVEERSTSVFSGDIGESFLCVSQMRDGLGLCFVPTQSWKNFSNKYAILAEDIPAQNP